MPNAPRPTNRARPVRIEDTLWAKVKALAAKRGVSSSEVVRTAVREHVERED